ncbi:hypothetical protein Bbelb_338660 [Branchiostoma belcheri]|nr:hypothetical protein Bbelb_338660 [Branchiostoma belcheri]
MADLAELACAPYHFNHFFGDIRNTEEHGGGRPTNLVEAPAPRQGVASIAEVTWDAILTTTTHSPDNITTKLRVSLSSQKFVTEMTPEAWSSELKEPRSSLFPSNSQSLGRSPRVVDTPNSVFQHMV